MADNNIDPEVIRDVNEKFAEMATLLGHMGRSFSDLSSSTAGQSGTITKGSTAFNSYTESLGRGIAARKIEQEAIEKSAATARRWEAAGAGATASVNTFASALLSSGTTLSKYSSTVETAGATVANFAKSFGAVGFAVGLAIQAITKLEVQALKYGDSLLAAKDELASFGAVGQLTSSAIAQMGKDAGYTSFTLSGWAKATKSLGTDIIGLSSTVNGGVKEFAALTKLTREQYDNFQAMGLSQEQVTQAQADYIKLQVLQGHTITAQMKSSGGLQKASLDYINNLEALSAITGLSVDQAKEVQRQAASHNEFQIKMMELENERFDLEGKNDAESVERRKAIDKETSGSKKMMLDAELTGDKAHAANIAHYIGSGGIIDESNKALFFSARKVGEQLEHARIDSYRTGEGIKDYAESQSATLKQFGSRAAVLSKELRDTTGLGDLAGMVTVAKSRGRDIETIFEDSVKRGKAAAAGKTPAKTEDDAEKVRLGIIHAQVATQLKLDEVSTSMLAQTAKLVGFVSKEAEMLEKLSFVIAGLAAAAGLASLALGKIALSGLSFPGKGVSLPAPSGGKYKPGSMGGWKEGAGTAAGESSKAGGLAKAGRLGTGLLSAVNVGGLLKGGAAAVGGLAIDYAGDYAKEHGHEKVGAGLGVAGSAVSGAGTGAMIGSIVPGVGTAVGGAVGGVVGGAYGIYKNWDTMFGKTAAEKMKEKLELDKKDNIETSDATKATIAFTKALKDATDVLTGITTGSTTGMTSSVSGAAEGGATRPTGSISTRSKQAMDILMSKGWTKEQASGIVGNLQQESNLDTSVVNTKENAQGIAQWRGSRLDDFKKKYGKDVKDASLEEQIDFLDHELHNKESKAGKLLAAQTTVEGAARVFDKTYERSAGTEVDKRIANAQRIAGMTDDQLAPAKIVVKQQDKLPTLIPTAAEQPVVKAQVKLPTAAEQPVVKAQVKLPTAAEQPVVKAQVKLPTAAEQPVVKAQVKLPTAAEQPVVKAQVKLPTADAEQNKAADQKAASDWAKSNKHDKAKIEKITGMSSKELNALAPAIIDKSPAIPTAVPTLRVAKNTLLVTPSPVIETPKPVVLGKVSDKAVLPAVPTARVAKTTSPVIETPKPVVLGKVSDKAVLPAVPTVTPTASVAKNTLLVTPTASELPRPVDFAKASNEQVAAATAKSTVTPTAAAVITPPPAPTKKHQISSEEMIAMLSDKLDIMIDKLATSNDLQDKILRYSHA